jgi:hypothetical protein
MKRKGGMRAPKLKSSKGREIAGVENTNFATAMRPKHQDSFASFLSR